LKNRKISLSLFHEINDYSSQIQILLQKFYYTFANQFQVNLHFENEIAYDISLFRLEYFETFNRNIVKDETFLLILLTSGKFQLVCFVNNTHKLDLIIEYFDESYFDGLWNMKEYQTTPKPDRI
jgi:hypothetical protein